MNPHYICMPSHRSPRRCCAWMVAAALTTSFIAGCQSPSTSQGNGRPNTATFVPPSALPVPDDTPATTIRSAPIPPDVLARQTNKYVQRVSAAKPSDPSVVDWADPEDLRLTNAPPREPQVVPIVKPVIATTPSRANTLTSVAVADTARTAVDSAAKPPGAEANSGIEVNIEPRGPLAQAIAPPPPSAGDALEQQLAQHVRDYPRDVWAQFDYQVLQFIHDQQVPQMQPLTPLPMEDRELISAVMDGLSNFRSTLRSDNNLLLSRKVKPLLDLADRLRAQADLTIPTLALCTRVEGFGVYTPIDPARFQTGREQPAVIYCEVENFSSQVDDHKMWETRLAQKAVLYTESGLPVWEDKSKDIIDHSRNRRHDFFITKVMRFPSTLTAGHYLLKVTVVDQHANRVAEATMPVQMVAP